MAVPSFMPILPQELADVGLGLSASWNRNPRIGKARAPSSCRSGMARDAGCWSPASIEAGLQILVLTRFLNANRFPLRLKTL
jgi:hypothetical protein